jgi:hypothetical protein
LPSIKAGQLQSSQFTDDDVKKRRRNTTFGLDPPSWKVAASLSFDVYGPSGVLIKSNFTRATLKTQTVNYFWFAVAMLQNGR